MTVWGPLTCCHIKLSIVKDSFLSHTHIHEYSLTFYSDSVFHVNTHLVLFSPAFLLFFFNYPPIYHSLLLSLTSLYRFRLMQSLRFVSVGNQLICSPKILCNCKLIDYFLFFLYLFIFNIIFCSRKPLSHACEYFIVCTRPCVSSLLHFISTLCPTFNFFSFCFYWLIVRWLACC